MEKHKDKLLYTISAITSFIIDILLFNIFKIIFKSLFSTYIYIASFLARAISSFYNYLFNKKIVFSSNNKNTLLKYYILVIINILISAIIVNILYKVINIDEVIIKICVDMIIFILNYIIQKVFIFKK